MPDIRPFTADMQDPLVALSLRAWEPVFSKLASDVPGFVYASFYPGGWQDRQYADLTTVMDEEPENIDVAVIDSRPVGWACTRIHPEDRMGELYVLAVDPDYQRRGIGRALMAHSFERIRAAGMQMAMVETGDDRGHAPGRAAYESVGFERWPVARYFKDLTI